MEPDFASLVGSASLRAVLERLPCVVYVTSATWPPKVHFMSPNVENYTGHTAEAFLANPLLVVETVHPGDRDAVVRTIRESIQGDKPYRASFRVLHKNGRDVFHIEMVSAPVCDAEGKVTHRHGILLDVTATRQLEQELLQSQRLAAIGEMAAMMAHEIRNPLAGMALALRALRPVVGDHADGKECLDDLDRCLERIDETVSRALEFARARPPSPRPCSLAQVVAAATQFTLPYVQRHRVTLATDVPDDLPPLFADPAQLEQVFVQLILNACKAMAQGGTLIVRARRADGRLVAEVADTGVGIAKERLEHIFTPYYSGFGEGSGLGLSLCQRIIAAHQGTIQVESTQGKGTLFRIELPLEAAHAPRVAR